MTQKQQIPGETCEAQRVWLSNDPLVVDIETYDEHQAGRRTCQRCGLDGVTVTRSRAGGRVGQWSYAQHVVPARAPRVRRTFNPKPRLAEDVFEHALLECSSRQDMAHRLGVSLRTIERAFDRYRPGAREHHGLPRTTAEHRHRIRLLASSGVPASWIAEELPFSYETVLEHARQTPGYAEQVQEWRRLWPSIRNNPALFALHIELSPKREKTIHGQRPGENRDHPGVRRVAAAA